MVLSTFLLRSGVFAALAIALVSFAGCGAASHHVAATDAMRKGDYVEAVRQFREAATMAPHDALYQRDLLVNREDAVKTLLPKADAAAAEGLNKIAQDTYTTVLNMDPSNEHALAGLAKLAESLRAKADMQQAQEAMRRGDQAQALRLAERVLDRTPNQGEAARLKATIEDGQAADLPSLQSLSNLYKKPVNLEFRDASVKMVFDALSRTTGINFIFDREVRTDQRTTVFLKQTMLDDAIDVILSTNQLEKKVLNASSVLIYPNTPAKVKEYQDLLVRAFYLANVDAKTAATMLKTVLKLKDVYIDEKYHMLILRENAATITLAEKLLALQDLEDPEVMLEIEVLEVNRNRLLNLGIQLTNQFTVSPLAVAGGVGSLTLSDFLGLNRDKLGITAPSATVSLQKTDGSANLLANPRLRVRDRDKAKILIGDKVPVTTTTTSATGFVSESVQYIEVGLKLDVEPEIHLHDEIGLKLNLEVSSLVAAIKTPSGSQAYQIGTRSFSSSLRLKDGETQVLAGLISDADRSDATRIPVLGDLPLLGRLFSTQKDDRQKTEVVMSITPHLIRNIQRKSRSAESFWSGTEATLRTSAIALRTVDAGMQTGVAGAPTLMQAPTLPTVPASPDTSGLTLALKGPTQLKVGVPVKLDLVLDSTNALRAVPLQLGFDATQFAVVSVTEGEYFGRGGKSQFSNTVDALNGRVSIGAASSVQEGVKGEFRLLTIELRPLKPATDAKLNVISLTPIGSTRAIDHPNLPISFPMVITP